MKQNSGQVDDVCEQGQKCCLEVYSLPELEFWKFCVAGVCLSFVVFVNGVGAFWTGFCLVVGAGRPGSNNVNKPICYPQQLGRSWNVFVLEPSGTLFAMCTGTFQNLIRYLPRNPPEPHQLSAPEPSGTSSAFCASRTLFAICTGTFGTLSAICARTLRNFISHLHPNPPEPRLLSAPEPSGTSSAICTGTRRNLSFLRRSPPEPQQFSAPEPSGTSSAFCTRTLRNLISHLHRNPLEPHQLSAPEPSGTFRNLLRNLGLQLRRIAPELFWAKDPIASLAVGEKAKVPRLP